MPCSKKPLSQPIEHELDVAFIPGAAGRRQHLRQKFLLPQDHPGNRYRGFTLLHSYPVFAP